MMTNGVVSTGLGHRPAQAVGLRVGSFFVTINYALVRRVSLWYSRSRLTGQILRIFHATNIGDRSSLAVRSGKSDLSVNTWFVEPKVQRLSLHSIRVPASQ